MDFREMTPSRMESSCCTGGGGAMSMSEYAKKRIEVGKVKADQIRETEARAVYPFVGRPGASAARP